MSAPSIYVSTGDVSGATDYASTGDLVVESAAPAVVPSSSTSSSQVLIAVGGAALGAFLAPSNGRVVGGAIGAVLGWFLGGVVALADEVGK